MRGKPGKTGGARGIRPYAAKIYRWGLDIKRSFLRLADKYSSLPKALVLVYHRVADISEDPLLLAVSAKNFEDQLSVIKNKFEIISTAELVERISRGSIKGNEAVITFDDGYKDNLTNALPIAKKLNVPITIFISTGILGGALPFPWDAEYSNKRESYLSEEDIKTLSKEPLVTLGSHTVSHPRLRDLPSESQKSEVSESKETLEGLASKRIEYFAYPFGDYPDINASAVASVKQAGYAAAFSNVQRMATKRSGMFKIPRILARNWSGEEMLKRLAHFIKDNDRFEK